MVGEPEPLVNAYVIHVAEGEVSYAHLTESGSTPLAIAASMFLAMLFLSFRLYTTVATIAVQVVITNDRAIVIKSLFTLDNSFCSVNFITFAFVENMPANLFLLF